MAQNVRIDGVMLKSQDGKNTDLLHAMFEDGRQAIFDLDADTLVFMSSKDETLPVAFQTHDEKGEPTGHPLHVYAGVELAPRAKSKGQGVAVGTKTEDTEKPIEPTRLGR